MSVNNVNSIGAILLTDQQSSEFFVVFFFQLHLFFTETSNNFSANERFFFFGEPALAKPNMCLFLVTPCLKSGATYLLSMLSVGWFVCVCVCLWTVKI